MIISATKPLSYEKDKYVATDKISITFLGLLSFICGLPSLYTLNLMGELYATEVILPVFTIILLLSGKEKHIFQEKIFWAFVLSTVVMIIGYIISDLVAGTSQFNYLRAWGRNTILFSDIVCLSIIAATDKRYVWWHIFGVSLGSIIYLQSTGVSFTNANWKLAYSQPILLLIFVAGYLVSNFVIIWLAIAVGIFSFYMDSRSFSSMCILLAGILWIRRGNPEILKISTKSLTKIIVAGSIAVLIILSVLAQTDEDFSSRRDISSIGRFAALRIAVIAISDSPILGFGSWGEGTKKYAAMLYMETQNEIHRLGQNNYHQRGTFMAHSQILQSWMEGGIFAAQLFIYYGYQILASLKKIILSRRLDYMTTFYCFLLLGAFWGLFMSPYSGGHRLGIAIAIAIICAVNVEISKRKKYKLAPNT
jgi:hypothetical protein